MPNETSSLEAVLIDPNTVVLDENVRITTALDEAFIESVREHGVQTPAIGYRNSEGTIHIVAGQRRTLAARETGQPLPVVLTGAHDGTRDRIVNQIIENDQRASLKQSERIHAWKQLSLEGMTAPAIAKTLGQPKASVKAGLAAAASKKPVDDEQMNQIDLLHLAALVEFEHDEEVYSDLLDCALEYPDSFEHRLESARRDIEDASKVEAHIAELQKQFKVTITREELERISETVKIAPESHLTKNESMEVTAQDVLNVRIMVTVRRYYGKTESEIVETPYIYDYPAHGYELQSWRTNGGSANAGPMTEEQKAERKLLIACNKAWDIAAPVRRRWLAEFLGGKKFPNDCGEFAAVSLLRFGSDIANRGQEMPVTLLGMEYKYAGLHNSQLANLVTERPSRAGAITLALVLGQFEDGMKRESWRYPSAEGKHYLQQIEQWGYPLSDVERLAAGYLVETTSEAA